MPKENHDIFEELSKNENRNASISKINFDKEIRNYKELFNLFNKLVDQIADKSIRREIELQEKDVVIINISNRIIGTSKVYLDLVMKGYSYDSNIILRSLLENTCLMLYFIKDKENIEKWLSGELKLKRVRKELGLFTDKRFSKIYEYLSDYVHSNFVALKSLNEPEYDDGWVARMTIEPRYRPNLGKYALFPSVGSIALAAFIKNFERILDPKMILESIALCEKIEKEAAYLFKERTESK